MQIHIRGQQNHVLEVQPEETISIVKVSCIACARETDLCSYSAGHETMFKTVFPTFQNTATSNPCASIWRYWAENAR